MKKLLILLAVTLFTVNTAKAEINVVNALQNAQEQVEAIETKKAEVTENIEAKKAEMKAKKEERKAAFKAKREEMRAKRKQRRAERKAKNEEVKKILKI